MSRLSSALLIVPIAVFSLQAGPDIPFSHKRHAPLKLECTYCHATARTGERASYPPASTCMLCHRQILKDHDAIRRLSSLPEKQAIEPERSVYQLAEFAHFSHARHTGKIGCQICHGNIMEMETVEPVLPMTMKACISCHQTMRASTKCGKCHELGAQ